MLTQINNTLKKHTLVVTTTLAVMVVVPFVMFTDSGDSLLDSRQNSSERIVGQVDGRDVILAEINSLKDKTIAAGLLNNLNLPGLSEADILKRIAVLNELKVDEAISSVTAEEIKTYITEESTIKNLQGQLGMESITDTLVIFRERLNITGLELDKIIKENIIIKKHEDKLKAAVTVSEADAKKSFTKENTEYAFKTRAYSFSNHAEAELKKAYDENIKDFESPEAIQAKIISFSAASFLTEAKNDKTKALELATAKAEAFRKTLSEKSTAKTDKAAFKDTLFQRTLKATAKTAGLTLEDSNFLTQEDFTNGKFYLNNKELTESILALTTDKNISSVIKTDTAVYLAFFAKKGQTKSLAEVRTEVLEKIYGDKVEAFYQEKKAGFNTQKQFSATAVQFNTAQFLSQVDDELITDKIIQDTYEQQTAIYGQKQFKGLTVSAAIAKDLSADKKATLKKELATALAEIAKTKGAELAKSQAKYLEKGLTVTPLSWTNETDVQAATKTLVEATEKNKASEIKEEDEQFLAVYILDKRDKTPIEEATVTITAEIKMQLATGKAFQAASDLQKASIGQSDLKALTLATVKSAQEAGATINALPKSTASSFLRNFQRSPVAPKLDFTNRQSFQAYQAVFQSLNYLSPENPVTAPYETQTGVAVLVLKEYDASRPQELAEVRGQILEILNNKAATALAQAAASQDFESYSTITDFTKNPDKASFTDKAATKLSALTANDKKAADKAETPGLYHLEKTTTGAEILFVSSIKKPTEKEIEEGYKTALEQLKNEAAENAVSDFYASVKKSITIAQEETAQK